MEITQSMGIMESYTLPIFLGNIFCGNHAELTMGITEIISQAEHKDYSLSRAGLNLQSSPTNMQSRPTFLLYMKIFYDNSLYVEQA